MSEVSKDMLKPCPFCGGSKATLHRDQRASMSWVACFDCGLQAPSETGVTDDDAVAYWNRRVPAIGEGSRVPVAAWGEVRRGSDGELAIFSPKFNSVKARFTKGNGNGLKAGDKFYIVDPRISLPSDAELVRMREALEKIATQKLTSEIGENELVACDIEGGYDACILTARTALSAKEQQ